MIAGINTDRPGKLHLDLNAAFASIEQQHDPDLRGRPLLVCAYANDASTIISPSLEARSLGIRTGMRVFEAKRIEPRAIVIAADPAKYKAVQRKLLEILDRYTPDVLPLSIDEAVFDLSRTPSFKRDLREVALEIKSVMRDELGEVIRCSIGISTNAYLAKIASGLEKPDGLQVIDHQNLVQVMGRLKLTDLTGIAERTERKLRLAGIYTPLQLLQADPQRLRRQAFGSIAGEAWYLRLRGFEVDFRPPDRKSYGHSFVLPRATSDASELESILLKLCEKTGRRLRKDGWEGRTLAVDLRYRPEGDFHRQVRVHTALASTASIYEAAKRLFEERDRGALIGFVGVSVSGIESSRTGQMELFQKPRSEELSKALDAINDRFGEYTVFPARMLGTTEVAPERIAFGRATIPTPSKKPD